MLYLGCALFGLGVGNMITLPGMIVQQEFPRVHFSRVISLVVGINQFTFAFGPALLGYLQGGQGNYSFALLACLVVEMAAAVIVVAPVGVVSLACAPRPDVTATAASHSGHPVREAGLGAPGDDPGGDGG
jgi:MFS family permease